MIVQKRGLESRQDLTALNAETEKFKERYKWLCEQMPAIFFEELDSSLVMLIVHNLMEFEAQGYSSAIHLKNSVLVLCLDEPDTDLQVLKNYTQYAIESYQAYVSKSVPTCLNVTLPLRIVVIHFFSDYTPKETPYPQEQKQQLRELVAKWKPEISDAEFDNAFGHLTTPFLRSLPLERLAIAIGMYCRATTRDQCQYEVKYNEDWETKYLPSLQIVLAWRNTPKHNFLYRLVRTIHRHGLVVKRISVSNQHPYHTNSILVLALDLHGEQGKSVWETADILDFLKELITVKYFASFDTIDHLLVQKGVISGNMGNLLRAMSNFIHQALVHLDVNLYTLEHVEEGLYRHPELAALLCEAFKYRFDPDYHDIERYNQIREKFLLDVSKLDTGHEENDIRRSNILMQGMNFIHRTLKTNFYRPNYTALSFRIDPHYLDEIPFDRTKKFPELPFGIIFVKGMHFFGFHIRFKDLARGGVRTVFPEYLERMILERNTVFTECYHLAYTQQMKNKDIPEGGAKAIIFLKPYARLESETAIFQAELLATGLSQEDVDKKIEIFKQEQRLEHLYQAQRAFIENLVTIVNCTPDGSLRAKDIIDYWKRPEYLYLGPDENMHDVMIQWIAAYSKKQHYKPGSSFISGKPELGINHKEYGVTSLGLNVYMEAVLHYLGIDPTKEAFTVKMSGGPDGDVAGNQIYNLYSFYPKTAKILALTDVSGTIHDPQGLDLEILASLFKKSQSIRYYPPDKLHEGGFLIDKQMKRHQTSLVQHTLCWRKQGGILKEDWLTGSDMNYLLRHNVHQTHADIFIPAGGRPRTLNDTNYAEFLDSSGKPTAKAIIEGANLYLTNKARRVYEELGTLIIKDSSANKTGVICSSFEVLCGLALGDETFVANKPKLVIEILERLKECASNEAKLLLRTHQDTGEFLIDISDKISKRINLFTDQLLTHLEPMTLSDDPKDPFIQCFLNYCLPLLKTEYRDNLLREIPSQHKKAVIACHIAAHLVYERGLFWFPSVVDILPMLLLHKEPPVKQ
jgi:glutamate dehydrogenase